MIRIIVYFEDGKLYDEGRPADLVDEAGFIWVDAKDGYSACRKQLRTIKGKMPFNVKVYTNSLDAFSNFWCWDEERKTPMIYIRNEDGDWTLIQDLTTRELRIAHNLEKLYVNGEFGNVEV